MKKRRPSNVKKVKTQLAALREARDQALALARVRADFIAHASHEIRTPLHGIVGYSTLLTGAELTDEQASLADALRTSIESLLSVVNDVLDLSRIDAGAMRLDAVGFDLLTLVRGTADLFAETARAKGVLIGVDTHDLTCRHLIGDPGRIRQVLGNLVANAIKFTDTGSVTVSVGTRRGRKGAVSLHISVIDTGPGIPRTAQRRLFQPFSRVTPANGPGKPGAGLGLAICRELVELMGGSIHVESGLGRGSTFSFRLPLKDDTSPIAARERQQLDVGRLRVYVADDDGRSRREILLALVSAGVGIAGSGPATQLIDALHRADEADVLPDIVIVGHVHQEGTDLAVARTMASDPRLARLPLVLVPLAGVRGHAREASEAGYRAYVPRPFRRRELLECVTAVALVNGAGSGKDRRLITRHNVIDGHELVRGRVLIADDDAASRDVTRLQVERLGFETATAGGGVEATAAALTGDYRVVLLDCQMPDRDGPTTAAEIRRREPAGQRITIIALTADVGVEQRERCRRAGMDGFLEKPVRSEMLAHLLQQHAHGRVLHNGPETSHSPHAPVQASATRLLEAEIGADMVIDLMEDYLAGVEQTLERLAHAQADERLVQSEAHRLLGSARILGLSTFEALWRPLAERAGRDSAWSPQILASVIGACAELRTWIEAQREVSHA